MSVTNLNIAVQITGADEAAGKLRNVENAADEVGKKVDKTGGFFAGFERQVKRLDDAVDSVEKPMRTFSGALDIASLALGVGLAGPLGQVIGQFGELAQGVAKAIAESELFVPAVDKLRSGFEAAGRAAASTKTDVDALIASVGVAKLTFEQLSIARAASVQTAPLESDIAAFDAQAREYAASAEAARQKAESLRDDARRLAVADTLRGAQLEASVLELALLAQQVDEQALEFEDRRATADFNLQLNTRKRDDIIKNLKTTLGAVSEAEQKQAVVVEQATKANERATASTKARTAAVKEATDAYAREISIIVEAEKEAQAAAEARAAYDALSPLQFIESLPPPTQSLQQALGDLIAPDAVAPEQVTAAESSLRGLTESAMDLESMGVGALQSFSQAAGQALATLVIDGDKAGVSFAKLAGQVAAGLSAQAFGYSVFLGALGVAAALTGPVLGYTAPGLFQAAGVMAGTGLLLAGTARALGASTVGGSSSAASSGASGGGAQDRVSSFSAGGGGAQPMQVTVVLGVDEVSNVLVRQSQRESRAGSLSSSRLAVV